MASTSVCRVPGWGQQCRIAAPAQGKRTGAGCQGEVETGDGGGCGSVQWDPGGPQGPVPHSQETLRQASRSLVVGGLGHTPNVCPPKTQLSPSTFTSLDWKL